MQQQTVKALLYRPIWLPVVIIAGTLLLSLALLLTNAWFGIERLEPVHAHLDRMARLQDTTQLLQKLLLDHLVEEREIPAAAIDDIRGNLDSLLASINTRSEPTLANSLERARQALDDTSVTKKRAIAAALHLLNDAIKNETFVHDTLFRQLRETAELEFSVAATTLIALPAFAIMVLFLVRKRILTPINSLAWLMSQLARTDIPLTPASVTTEIDPLLKPLVDHYNAMVGRLAHLEREHQNRQESLESQIGAAAANLLDQQRTLAKAEQLAAVGELAARLAHELRNPLAGMQVAITNLQQEVSDADQIARLGLVANELERVTFLLNGLLDQARLRPEPITTIHLAAVIGELLTLARYQLPAQIQLQQEIDESLTWPLPENELRRSLLNLVLNARQAIGDAPGTIRVTARQEGTQLRIEVCDDGPGFPADLLTSGVRSFTTTRSEGTGLGLSAVQRFAQELHGRMVLSNHEPHGACISLTIPKMGAHDA